MNRFHRALAGVVLLGAVLGTAACSDDSPSPTPAATTPAPSETEAATATATATTAAATSTPTATPTATAAGGSGPEVQAPIGGFVLPTLTVDRGTTVIWSNQDGVPHTATADDGEFNSGTLNDQTFRHTFEEAGTFSYFCEVHPTMTATITVN